VNHSIPFVYFHQNKEKKKRFPIERHTNAGYIRRMPHEPQFDRGSFPSKMQAVLIVDIPVSSVSFDNLRAAKASRPPLSFIALVVGSGWCGVGLWRNNRGMESNM
jgi:hypothetical protein